MGIDVKESVETESNNLFPIFVNIQEKALLIIGGGMIGLEKVQTLLKHCPESRITLLAKEISPEIYELAKNFTDFHLIQKVYSPEDLILGDIIIVAVGDIELAKEIKADLEGSHKLINVADKPELCDFYLGAVVKKGNLKIAISTNGKSPTIAKRLKENLNDWLPSNLDDLVINMSKIRKEMVGNFEEKVQRLNEISSGLSPELKKGKRFTWPLYAFLGILLILLGWIFSLWISPSFLFSGLKSALSHIDPIIYWMFLTGFCAQLVNGALGMGYGVISTLILLFLGIKLPAISGSIHTAELFSSGAGGIVHYRLKNFNKKLFKTLVIPGILGGILGAFILSKFGDQYAYIIKPIWGFYTLYLGIRILSNAFQKQIQSRKIKFLGWLALWGGFLDSFGGGGWGPLVTGTLIYRGKNPKTVIGTTSISKFFVTLAGAITFFSMLGLSHLPIIIGLLAGGLVAGPIGPRLSGRLSNKYLFIAVGVVVIISSLRMLLGTFHII